MNERPQGKKRILLVDDDASFLTTAREFVENLGYVVGVAGGGKAALKLLREQVFDLVITDILMSEGDGLDLIRAIHQGFPNLPVIAFSGGGEFVSAEYAGKVAIPLGAVAFLPKPVVPGALQEAIEDAFARSSVH